MFRDQILPLSAAISVRKNTMRVSHTSFDLDSRMSGVNGKTTGGSSMFTLFPHNDGILVWMF